MDSSTLRKLSLNLLWEARYRGVTPGRPKPGWSWFLPDCPSLDPDIERALREHDIAPCQTLDIGTGTGSQAIALASLGYETTAIDVSDTALDAARRAAAEQRVAVTFLGENILLDAPRGPFDLVVDRGCFTLLSVEHQKTYAESVERLSRRGAWLLLKTDLGKGDAPIRTTLQKGFRLVSIHESAYHAHHRPGTALFSVLRKASA